MAIGIDMDPTHTNFFSIMAIGIDMDPTHQRMFYDGYWYRHGSHSSNNVL